MNTSSCTFFLGFALAAAISAGTAFTFGCAENEAEINLRIPAAERPDVDASVVARGTISLPGKTPFNLKSFVSNQENDGRGEATAVGADGAVCRAEAHDGGSAWGRFVLGYDFDNDTSGPLEAVVKVRVRHMESNNVSKGAGDEQSTSSTSTGLVFRIQDTNGVVVRSEDLASGSLSEGPRAVTRSHELSFDARFESGRGYYLAIYGRCEAKAGPSKSAEVSLEISEYNLDIAWKPAESAGVAPDSDQADSRLVEKPSVESSEDGAGS